MALVGEQVTSNLPTLPDGSPNPNYNPKGFAGYAAPSVGMTQALTNYNSAVGANQGYNDAVGATQSMINAPGTLSKMGFDPSRFAALAGRYLGSGTKVADSMDAALTQRRQNIGRAAYADLNTSSGAGGNLGGTVAGIGKLDLASRYNEQATNDAATVANTRESILRGRMSDVLGGAGLVSGVLGNERTGNLMASQNLASLALQNQGQQLDAYGNLYNMETDLANRPMNYAFGNYQSWLNRPQTASDLDAALGIVGAGASMASGLGYKPLR